MIPGEEHKTQMTNAGLLSPLEMSVAPEDDMESWGHGRRSHSFHAPWEFLHRRPPVAADARAHGGRRQMVPESTMKPKGCGVAGLFLPLRIAWDKCSTVRTWGP